jgi:hypothetical protein
LSAGSSAVAFPNTNPEITQSIRMIHKYFFIFPPPA